MSKYDVACGHSRDGHCIIEITKEGFKAFSVWKKFYGKKPYDYIIKKGGGFKKNFIIEKTSTEDGTVICTDCLSNWKVYVA